MKQIMDGCTAAAHVAYAMSDVATIYPITPVASMGETTQKWGLAGRKNYIGVALRVEEMESELGAAGATHGALAGGSLATTFTNSQGLLLMYPNMFKIAGNRLPAVFHVGSRSVASHALSIFSDHQDVMATRPSGFAYLASASVQETMDLAVVAHLAAVDGSMPVCHFFDGWRTSNEMSTIDVIDYDDIFGLIEPEKVAAFRRRSLNPEHPCLRGSSQGPGVFFQNAEAANRFYIDFPAIVQRQMDRLAKVTGRGYHLFDYHGAESPDRVVVSIGSSCEVVEECVDYLNSNGYAVGAIKVRLFRPFCDEAFLALLPRSVKTVVVLDRCKDAAASGEPLLQDVVTAIFRSGRSGLRVIGGRYGLSSKDFNPSMVKRVFDEAGKENPMRSFTVGITDDVTHLSLEVADIIDTSPKTGTSAIFYGMGSDGTVGATKQLASMIGGSEGLYAQAYFDYSAKKSGGYTVSQLRFDHRPIRSEYKIERADYVGCNKDNYVDKFDLVGNLRQGGIFVLNCGWTPEQLNDRLPAALRRKLASLKARFYVIDANRIAHETGLGVRINTVMETVFLKLIGVIDFETGLALLKERVKECYAHEGGAVVDMNLKAIDMAAGALNEVPVPEEWANAVDHRDGTPQADAKAYGIPLTSADFFRRIGRKCNRLEGDSLPVSVFAPDGVIPPGTTAFEKRCVALNVPQWDPEKCVACTTCSLVCPHAVIRPYLLDKDEVANAPAGFSTRPLSDVKALEPYRLRIQISPMDCMGCGSCATVCPGHALTMVPIASQLESQLPLYSYAHDRVTVKDGLLPRFTIDGSQLNQPLLEFSGACAGCGETPYVKLLTQLFGERMIMANATGCSSIWGGSYPGNPYCTRVSDGRGPAWGNSLFEDNAEFGYGIAVSCRQRREALEKAAGNIVAAPVADGELVGALKGWLAVCDDPQKGHAAGREVMEALEKAYPPSAELPADIAADITVVRENGDMFTPKSVWAVGGDGWAYDIGFAGLDHVLASGENINILVLDTECYSNTGGQTSKATPLGAVTKYSPAGKRTFKKDLGRMMMTYGTVYVASVALGANYQQTIDAMREAEAYPGPSVIIAYCPCINHGIRAGMGTSIIEERRAVACGYWPLYRFNPSLAADGLSPYIVDDIDRSVRLNDLPPLATPSPTESADMAAAGEGPWDKVNAESSPLTVDYSSPDGSLGSFLDGEDRYADIRMVAPADAQRLRSTLDLRLHLLYRLLTSSL